MIIILTPEDIKVHGQNQYVSIKDFNKIVHYANVILLRHPDGRTEILKDRFNVNKSDIQIDIDKNCNISIR